MAFRTPQDLVEALHARQPAARQQLHRLLSDPMDRLMGDLISRHALSEDRELLVSHALHLAETMIRFRPPASFDKLTWDAFRATLLLQVARLSVQPYSPSRNGVPGLPPIPPSQHYDCETFLRPYTRLGSHYFGGDWYAGQRHTDGSLWVFLGDVTGHGYYAYLLATALSAIWQRCWQTHPTPEPVALLETMHGYLEECLPDGIFLESTLVKLSTEGRATIVPAGGTRYFRSGTTPKMVRLRGAWLGLQAPRLESQHHLELACGEELLLVTDGVFDQLDHLGDPDAVAEAIPTHQQGMLVAVREMIEQALVAGPQKDDITMVLLRRRQS